MLIMKSGYTGKCGNPIHVGILRLPPFSRRHFAIVQPLVPWHSRQKHQPRK